MRNRFFALSDLPDFRFSVRIAEVDSSTYETGFLHFHAFSVSDFRFKIQKSASGLLKLAILHFPGFCSPLLIYTLCIDIILILF